MNRLSVLEGKIFGWNHGDAAGIMARQWNLPEEFSVLLEGHSDAGGGVAGQANPGAAAVALSALLPSTVDPIWIECRPLEQHWESICPPAGGPSWPNSSSRPIASSPISLR